MVATLAEFLEGLDISGCRISGPPRMVFLCGGKVRTEVDQPTAPYTSARDYFYLHVRRSHPELSKRIALAETLSDSFDNAFSDLLELEEYVADVSDLIIIFVESAGSIAELGAFAPAAFGPKVLAIVNGAHPDTKSFIADGPVRRIKSYSSESVRCFTWYNETLADPKISPDFEDMVQDITEVLAQRATTAPKEQRLNLSSHGHRMLFLVDMVEVLGLASETDLADCLSVLGIDLCRGELKKYLRLVKLLKLVNVWRYTDQTYYANSMARESGFIRYGFVAGTKLRDRDRIRSNVRREMAHNNRWQRAFRAFQSHAGKIGAAHA